MDCRDFLRVLKHQRDHKVDGSVYKFVQCDFAYNSNHMEGSRLTQDQTRTIFESGTVSGNEVHVDDVSETRNHFRAFDYLLDNIDTKIDDQFLFTLQRMLKEGTNDYHNPVMNVGGYKIADNMIGDFVYTARFEDVPKKMSQLLGSYYAKQEHSFDDLLDFHEKFEKIHPFSDGNGRVGRLILFKECFANDILPFIITEDLRPFYIRGLQNWDREKGYLRDTCLTALDRMEARYLPLAKSYLDALDRCEAKPLDEIAADKEQVSRLVNGNKETIDKERDIDR